MRYFLLITLFCVNIFAVEAQKSKVKYEVGKIPKNMSVAVKKERFFYLVGTSVAKIHTELMKEYDSVSDDIINKKNRKKIEKLKIKYKAKTDKELLAALKPHPKSIVLAQAAMESAWGTSRFFLEANNIFGVWSFNKKEKRIAASGKRKGGKTIWLKKFDTIDDSVRDYFKVIAKGKGYKEFRDLRVNSSDVHKLVKKLNSYSEMGALYGKELSKLIKYNKLTRYD